VSEKEGWQTLKEGFTLKPLHINMDQVESDFFSLEPAGSHEKRRARGFNIHAD